MVLQTAWARLFLRSRSVLHRLVPVPRFRHTAGQLTIFEYLAEDTFNLYGLANEVNKFQDCLDIICGGPPRSGMSL